MKLIEFKYKYTCIEKDTSQSSLDTTILQKPASSVIVWSILSIPLFIKDLS